MSSQIFRGTSEQTIGVAPLARVRDEAAQVPAVGVDDLALLGEQVVYLFRLFAGAFDRAAGARGVVERPAVVVAELHDDEVAGLEHG